MDEWSAELCNRPPMWSHWTDGVHQEYRDLAESMRGADQVKLLNYAAHILSFQAFTFNLFLPFREGGRGRLSKCVSNLIGDRLRVDEVRFEWVSPGDLLGELKGEHPVGDETATAADVVLWGWFDDGQLAAVLIEVKLSEDGFTDCYGSQSPANRRRDVCNSPGLFFSDQSACYLRRPKGKQRDRRYWKIFAKSHGSVSDAFPGADPDRPCPFAGNAQQPMRNLAIAQALEQEGMVARAWFVLCAHDDNPDVQKHWKSWSELLPDPTMAPMLPASVIIDVGEAEEHNAWAGWMRERYRLGKVR